ncbi:MAG: hypothetical protein QUT30_04590, partial [Acidobacteriota bacterium]|nr:hypothetical protein [Acidobacteriota bacterium]
PMVFPIRRELTGAPESRRLFCGRDGRAPRSSLGGLIASPWAALPRARGAYAAVKREGQITAHHSDFQRGRVAQAEGCEASEGLGRRPLDPSALKGAAQPFGSAS